MYDLSLVNKAYYDRKLADFASRHIEDADDERDVIVPVPIKVLSNVGKRFSRTALSAFHSGDINGPDLSDLLNMRLQHLDALELKLSKAGA